MIVWGCLLTEVCVLNRVLCKTYYHYSPLSKSKSWYKEYTVPTSPWSPDATDTSQRNMRIMKAYILFGHFTKFQLYQKLMAKIQSCSFLVSSLCKLKSIYLSLVVLLANHHFKGEKGRGSWKVSWQWSGLNRNTHFKETKAILYHREIDSLIKEYRLIWPFSQCMPYQGFRQPDMQPVKILGCCLCNNKNRMWAATDKWRSKLKMYSTNCSNQHCWGQWGAEGDMFMFP